MADVTGSGFSRASMMTVFRALREEEVAVICSGYVNEREVCWKGCRLKMWGGLCLCWTILYAVCSSPHRPGLHSLLFTPHAIHSCMWPALLPLQVVSLHSILYFVTFLCTIYSPPPAGWACRWQGHSLDCTPFIPVRFLPSSTRFRLTPEHSVFLLE